MSGINVLATRTTEVSRNDSALCTCYRRLAYCRLQRRFRPVGACAAIELSVGPRGGARCGNQSRLKSRLREPDKSRHRNLLDRESVRRKLVAVCSNQWDAADHWKLR